MKVPKKQVNFKVQVEEPEHYRNYKASISPNRYRGTSRLYQLNLSKMLLKCPEAISPFGNYQKRDINIENSQQLLIVSTTFSSSKTSVSQKLKNKTSITNQSTIRKNKVAQHRKNLTRKLELIAADIIRKQTQTQKKFRKQNKSQKELGEFGFVGNQCSDGYYKHQSQLLISEKVLHDQSTKQVKQIQIDKSTFSPERTSNIKRHSFNTINKPFKAVQLPQLKKKKIQQSTKTVPSYLKTNKKNSLVHIINQQISTPTINTNSPLLIKDQDYLKVIKSESYAVMEYPTGNLILSSKGQTSLEIASLTKIMTFYTIRKIAQEFYIDIKEEKIIITDQAMDMSGTSAEIITGEVYTIYQLLHGLMLPSGNDAAMALAEWGGQFINANSYDALQKFPTLTLPILQNKPQNKLDKSPPEKIPSKQKIKIFLCMMNLNAKNLNLSYTKFANPHGLPHSQGKSSAVDVAKLCVACLDDQIFIEVGSAVKFKCSVNFLIEENKKKIVRYSALTDLLGTQQQIKINKDYKRIVQWENTNKLLRRDNFVGIKTGVTVTAGPCLATAYRFRDKIYVTVLLRALKVSRRFKQTRKILVWCLEKIYKNSLTPIQRKILADLKRNRPEYDSDYSEDQHEFNYDTVSTAEYKKRLNFINYEM